MDYEKMWNELKTLVIDKAHFYENKGYMHQGAILVDVVEDMEELEKEFKSKEDFIYTLHNDMFNKQLEKENDE
ncbi:hypothetical protein [Macrococcoides caseolyticum]|uniref:Uncharacterized protein n=1 Tax=Macrococcoides caseolyticum TaxID=69966 RepID=A0ACC9MSU4_9STAP|nr:hypothetical protein [Macrococcus caseolyticus]PKE39537.1 hypothetical protein CW675_06230 [Macrococcus caseolyticus]PKE56752.1 hypothetical protein CW682_04365 [Macrococcus caseolyticus]